jgi:hypothetical protein
MENLCRKQGICAAGPDDSSIYGMNIPESSLAIGNIFPQGKILHILMADKIFHKYVTP